MPNNYGYSKYSNRGGGRNYDDEEEEEEAEDDNGIKPYTAVGAALDSASRFQRRMNYGRKPTKTEASINKPQRTPRMTPRYMKPTEAATRKSVSSRSESADLREKYPNWYENQENNSESGRTSDNQNSTDYDYKEINYYDRTHSPERSTRSPSGNNEGRRYDRKSSLDRKQRSPSRKKYDYNDDRKSSPNNDYSPERNQRSPLRNKYDYNDADSSPERKRRSPSGKKYNYINYKKYNYNDGKSSPTPERKQRSPSRNRYNYNDRRTSPDDYHRKSSPERNHRSPDDYRVRRGSTDSYQTVKIRRSDLDEIRNRYSLKFKDREESQKEEEETNKSNIYKYSSNMRRGKARSISAESSVQSRDNYGRPRSQSGGRRRTKEDKERREESENAESRTSSKLTPQERYARRKSYDASRSRTASPMPDLRGVRSSGYGGQERENSYHGRETRPQQRSFRLMPSVEN